MTPKLGIAAGAGPLPRYIVSACKAQGREYFIIAVPGVTDPETVEGEPHVWHRLGAGARHLKVLRQQGCKEVVMIGPLPRPTLAAIRPDWFTLKKLIKVGYSSLGDDGALRSMVRGVEEEGFKVIGADSILSDLLAPEGVLGAASPSEQDWIDIKRGIAVVNGLGLVDVGQAAIVQQGIVLGVEAAEGTDGLIRRTAELRRPDSGGVLVKLKKPQQERRIDLPTVGVTTVRNLAAAGHKGLAVAASDTMIVDIVDVVREADEHGIFVVGLGADVVHPDGTN